MGATHSADDGGPQQVSMGGESGGVGSRGPGEGKAGEGGGGGVSPAG